MQYFQRKEFKKHNKEGSATHIASHMALGAVVSALGGNDAVSGALAAGGAEALVPLFSKAIYDTKDPEKLTAEQKQNLSNMARLFGAAVGNGTANGYANVAQGSLNAGVAWENNGGVMDRPDGLTPDERALRERANRIYRDNVEAKNLYIQSYEEYQLKADYLATKEILVGTWDSIRHPIDTLTTIAEALSSPKQTVNNLIMTYQDWKTIRDSAYINDPKLAARMDAMFNARVGANVGFMVISGGTASAITKSSAALKAANTIKSAANSKVWQPVNQALQKARLARELSKAADNLPPVPLKPVPAILQNIGKPTAAQISEAAIKIAEYRKANKARSGNFGYLDGVVNGKKVDNRMWRSVSKKDILNEPQIFTATEVKGSNGQTWLRNVDSEYRMLNNLAHELGAKSGHVYPQIRGNLTIVSEHPYCSSCSNVIQQFQTMFPNIKLTLINGVK